MNFFLNEILENDEIRQILSENSQLELKAKAIAEEIINTKSIPKIEAGILPIFVLGFLSNFALLKNNERGIDKDITVKTLKDINIWLDNYKTQHGVAGLGEFHWLINHYTADLFKLGRLQFRIEKCLDGIPFGEFAIETHIPQGEPLNVDACLESFNLAKNFFREHFPEHSPSFFMCDSWLLNPNLANILSEESNIVRFMKLWTPIPFPSDNSAQAIERVFGFGYTLNDILSFPEQTSLQRNFKKYLKSGGTLDITAGYRKI